MSRDWIVQTSSTTGTGPYTLGDPPLGTSYFPFRQRIDDGDDTVRYWVVNAERTKWEKNSGGELTYGVSPGTDTLSRNVVESTNGDAPISWIAEDLPLRVYVAPDSDVEEGAISGFLAATRPPQLRAGGRWWDRAAGLAVSWIDKLATGAATNIRLGLYDAVKGIYFADGRRPWTAVGANNKTVAAADIGGVFTQDNSVADRTLTLPAHDAAGVGEGFKVGGLGLTAGGQYGILLTPAAGDGIDGGADAAVKRIAGGVRFDVEWDAAGDTWRVTYLNTVPAVWTGRRQTVAAGPVSSAGLPTFLPSTNGALSLTMQNVSASARFVATAANGWDYQGRPADRIGVSLANLQWTGLTASRAAATPNFLYLTIGTDGVLTPGTTLLAPIYQHGGTPATTNGQFTFNIAEMKGYLGNGSSAPEAFAVFVGEAATDGSGVISTVAYAYNGLYESAFTATLPAAGTVATANHNIGAQPRAKELVAECTTIDLTYAVGQQISTSTGLQAADAEIFDVTLPSTRNTVSAGVINGGSWAALYADLTNRGAITRASWKYKFVADRGWG
jgi:hypothetical protein